MPNELEESKGKNIIRRLALKILSSKPIVYFYKRRGKYAFLSSLPQNCKILDVGCGNSSPKKTRSIRPDLYYIGIDVGDYNNSEESLSMADEYILTDPENFDKTIGKYAEKYMQFYPTII